jgi:putative ABC transport system ATP-binding protein
LNAVAGAWFVDGGKIELDDRDVTRWPEYKRAALVGRVFQNPFSGTSPNLSIAENVALAARRGMRRGLGWSRDRKLMDQIRSAVSRLSARR